MVNCPSTGVRMQVELYCNEVRVSAGHSGSCIRFYWLGLDLKKEPWSKMSCLSKNQKREPEIQLGNQLKGVDPSSDYT